MNFNLLFKSIVDNLLRLGYFLFGGWDKLLVTLVSFMGVSFILFVVYSISHHEVSLKSYCNALLHKFYAFLFIAIANILDKQIFNADATRTLAIIFYIVMEGKFILKTARDLGIKFPKVISDVIDKLDNSSEERTP